MAAAASTAVAHHRLASFRPNVATAAGCPVMLKVVAAALVDVKVVSTMSAVAQPLYTTGTCTPATDSWSPSAPWWKGKMQGSLRAGGETAVQEMGALWATVSRGLVPALTRAAATRAEGSGVS